MVPASALVLGAAMLLSRNVHPGLLRPRASQAEVLRVSRLLVLVVMATALAFAVGKPSLVADLLLAAYDGVTQLFPAVLLALVWRRTSKVGVAAGVTVGVALVLYLMLGKHDPLWASTPASWRWPSTPSSCGRQRAVPAATARTGARRPCAQSCGA